MTRGWLFSLKWIIQNCTKLYKMLSAESISMTLCNFNIVGMLQMLAIDNAVSQLSCCFSYLWSSALWSDGFSRWHQVPSPLIKVVSEPNMGRNIREMASSLPIKKAFSKLGWACAAICCCHLGCNARVDMTKERGRQEVGKHGQAKSFSSVSVSNFSHVILLKGMEGSSPLIVHAKSAMIHDFFSINYQFIFLLNTWLISIKYLEETLLPL